MFGKRAWAGRILHSATFLRRGYYNPFLRRVDGRGGCNFSLCHLSLSKKGFLQPLSKKGEGGLVIERDREGVQQNDSQHRSSKGARIYIYIYIL